MNVKDINIRDPFILVENGKYYLYARYNDTEGFAVRVSDDLVEWSDEKPIFLTPKDFWATRDFWAPEVHKYKGKYYLFASLKSETRERGTQIFVSDAPDGTFTPLTEYPVTPENWGCLDGTLYVEDGIPYMVFCHEWAQCGGYGEMCYMQLSDDLSHAVSEPVLMFRANDPVWAENFAAHRNLIGYVTDGPFMHITTDGRLMMIWSSFCKDPNGTDGHSYVEAMAYSDNGRLDGKWIHADRFLLSSDGGHGMLFEDRQGQLSLILHSPNTANLERAKVFRLRENPDDGLLEIIE